MSSELMEYITDEMLERIINLYPKSFIIKFNGVKNENLLIGKVLFCNKTTKKIVNLGKNVTFPNEKIKFKTNKDQKYNIAVVNQYWVKPFINNPKISINVKVYKSKLNNSNERIYYEDDEKIELTYSQYIKRMLIYDFRKYKHQVIAAYENFKQRYASHGNYYLALNETCKHYFISHEILKIILSRIDNAKKRYKKNWINEYIKHLQNDIEQRMIDKLIDEFEDKDEVELNKVIYLGNR